MSEDDCKALFSKFEVIRQAYTQDDHENKVKEKAWKQLVKEFIRVEMKDPLELLNTFMIVKNSHLDAKLAIFKSKHFMVFSLVTEMNGSLKAFLSLSDYVMHFDAAENTCRLRHGLPAVDWKEELALGMAAFSKKSRYYRSYRYGKTNRFVPYFKRVKYDPLQFLVHAEQRRNQESYFYKLISSMDEDCELNIMVADRLPVSIDG
jgi:glutaredoxin-related protein